MRLPERLMKFVRKVEREVGEINISEGKEFFFFFFASPAAYKNSLGQG